MPRLLLLRHAKSDWSAPGQGDHDRALSERGRRDAPRMGVWMAREGLAPDRVLCSTARRARETLALVLGAMEATPRVDFVRDIYAGGANALIELARARGDGVERLMMVGHNPLMEETAARLAGEGEAEELAQMAAKFPTGALAVIEFAADWGAIAPGHGRLVRFVRPKALQRW